MVRLGVDLGGTKIEIIAIDGDGRELLRRRVTTPRHDYQATLDTVVELVTHTEAELGARGSVGFGTPGSISPATGLLRNSNSTWLNGKPLLDDLSARLQREVRIENDANCFALSEATDGAAAGQPVVFGVILGTGVGGAIVIDGKLVSGASRIAGEWGHNPLPWPRANERPGPDCYCGLTGCIETFLCGPGLTQDHLAVTGENLHSMQIVERATAGDPACDATLARARDQHRRSARRGARRRNVEH